MSDDGQRNCPKYVEFYPKNKFQKLVHLVDFIIRTYHNAQSSGRKKKTYSNIYSNPGTNVDGIPA